MNWLERSCQAMENTRQSPVPVPEEKPFSPFLQEVAQTASPKFLPRSPMPNFCHLLIFSLPSLPSLFLIPQFVRLNPQNPNNQIPNTKLAPIPHHQTISNHWNLFIGYYWVIGDWLLVILTSIPIVTTPTVPSGRSNVSSTICPGSEHQKPLPSVR